MRSTQVTFRMSIDREREFLRQYMIDAWDRLTTLETVDSAWFWRFGSTAEHDPIELEGGEVVDGGGVILVVNGAPDPDPAVAAERERWERLQSEGLLDDWETKGFRPAYENARAKMIENFGERGGELMYRLRPLATETTLAMLEEFNENLPPVGEPTDKNPVPVGEWVLLHLLMKQNGHDWHEEIDACRKAIHNRVQSLRSFHGPETALEALDSVIADLETARESLEEAT